MILSTLPRSFAPPPAPATKTLESEVSSFAESAQTISPVVVEKARASIAASAFCEWTFTEGRPRRSPPGTLAPRSVVAELGDGARDEVLDAEHLAELHGRARVDVAGERQVLLLHDRRELLALDDAVLAALHELGHEHVLRAAPGVVPGPRVVRGLVLELEDGHARLGLARGRPVPREERADENAETIRFIVSPRQRLRRYSRTMEGEVPEVPGTALFDLVIVGAGPAGIALGAEAVAAGIPPSRVLDPRARRGALLLDPEVLPRLEARHGELQGLRGRLHGRPLPHGREQGRDAHLPRPGDREQRPRPCATARASARSARARASSSSRRLPRRTASKTCAIAIGILGPPEEARLADPVRAQGTRSRSTSRPSRSENADVLVVGGGDSASEYVQYLVQEGCRVVLSYRGALVPADERHQPRVARGARGGGPGPRPARLERRARRERRRAAPASTSRRRDGSPGPETFDHVVLALGGTTPENFLRTIGIDFDGAVPVLRDGYETSIPGLFLVGDLTAGKTGGSIISRVQLRERGDARALRGPSRLPDPAAAPPRSAALLQGISARLARVKNLTPTAKNDRTTVHPRARASTCRPRSSRTR